MPGRVEAKNGRGGHSITLATLGVEWAQPLGEEDFKAILDRHEAIAPDLPRKQAMRGMTINLAAPQQQASAAQTGISGLAFDRVKPNGEPAWMIVVNPTLIGVSCGGSEYTRWSEVFTKAGAFLNGVLDAMPARPITIVALQYVDEFVWRGDNRDEFVPNRLFRRETRHLVPAVFDAVGLWHSHVGFYRNSSEPVPHRTLNNVNVQVLDTEVHRLAQVVMAHRLMLETPVADRSAEMFAANGLFSALYGMLHTSDKDLLRDLLIQPIAQQIGLEAD